MRFSPASLPPPSPCQWCWWRARPALRSPRRGRSTTTRRIRRSRSPGHSTGAAPTATCAPSRPTTWSELAGFKNAIKRGARFSGYIGHDEPATLFYSNQPGAGNNVSWQLTLPKEPPTAPTQTGSGGTDSFMLHPTFWFGMVMCDPNGLAQPRRADAHRPRDRAVQGGQQQQHLREQNASSPRYFGLGPGQAYEELQFYPPGWVARPQGIGCNGTQWCAALNIDTFSEEPEHRRSSTTPPASTRSAPSR